VSSSNAKKQHIAAFNSCATTPSVTTAFPINPSGLPSVQLPGTIRLLNGPKYKDVPGELFPE